jgi:hypothetical protein
MKTIKKVNITPVWVDLMPDFDTMVEGHVYISEKYHSSTHRCFCGCGSKTVLPLNRDGSTWGWDLIKYDNNVVSFTPSVGNQCFNCKSHYIITRNVANFV